MISVFLNFLLTKHVYIEQPEYFHNSNKMQVLLFLQGLYGLKQAARLWFATFKEEIQKLGFVKFYYNSALYLNNNETYFVVHVDDVHTVRPDLSLIVELKKQPVAKFKRTDLGPTFHYLGMEVLHKNHTITVVQTVHIDQLFTAFQMPDCNPAYTPMGEGSCLASASDNYVPNLKEISAYQRFTGSIQWMECQTRPEILQTVIKPSQHNIKQTDQCWTAVTHLLRYLKSTLTRGIHYSNGNLILYRYSDSL